jgi:CRISPR/Cas system-associated exonuclease Cas4 (RecB family)
MDKATLIKALVDHDNSRARSKQTAIGVSSLGDCRRKVYFMMNGAPATNDNVLRLPAIMGTAIHAAIENAIGDEDGRYLIEHRVELDGLPPATIDFFDTVEHEVIDWKTITKKNVDYFVTQQKRWQVQVYGYLMTQAGYEVKTVTLIGIPRDGTENDIITHSEPYDRNVALEALQWLTDLQEVTEAPAPERDPATFCKNYCQFYGGACLGKSKDVSGQPITDDTATRAAKTYLEILVKEKALASEKDAAKAALEGYNGVTFDGITVNWSEIAGRSTPDTDAIQKAIGSVPMKQGNPSTRLTVK